MMTTHRCVIPTNGIHTAWGQILENDGFLYSTMYCTHYTGTGIPKFSIVSIPVPVPCIVYEPLGLSTSSESEGRPRSQDRPTPHPGPVKICQNIYRIHVSWVPSCPVSGQKVIHCEVVFFFNWDLFVLMWSEWTVMFFDRTLNTAVVFVSIMCHQYTNLSIQSTTFDGNSPASKIKLIFLPPGGAGRWYRNRQWRERSAWRNQRAGSYWGTH